jgi:hypothetical protein
MGKDAYRVAAPANAFMTSNKEMYFKMIRKALKAHHPKAQLVMPRFEPVVGAALIALDEIGVKWTPAVIANVEKSIGC